ncbi:MarR family winged helix-turn-helix transcriptional regulator [Numidum massiliense]|uniref:MarR family winged helix-turn-helix transcriptional regulator n=1 Tax=Numidum massiliense TaxID=1522315 RepID=UPI0006D5A0A8|nr:MarR family transcriptional regulator [Numidum massiliense]
MNRNDDLLQLEDVFKQVSKKLSMLWHRTGIKISGSHARILAQLDREGPQKTSDLAKMLGMTAGGVTGLADKLIAEGLATRRRAENDRRIVYLEITDKGKDMLTHVREQREKMKAAIIDGLTDKELHHMLLVYKKILQNIEDALK